MIYQVIDQIRTEGIASAQRACEVLGVSRGSFRRDAHAEASVRECSDAQLMPALVALFKRHRRRYGARRISQELRRQGYQCGRDRASKLLKTAGLSAIQPRSFKPRSTESRHKLGYNKNLLLDRQDPQRVNQIWVGDITYIPTAGDGFTYLAVLLDRYSRRIVGWSLKKTMNVSLVTDALRMSIRDRNPKPSLIHHTDRGGQYAAASYRSILKRSQMTQSMSRAGDCYDNAFMESCFGTIKNELQMTEYENCRSASREIAAYVRYYNYERIHSSIGYLAPHEFESANQIC